MADPKCPSCGVVGLRNVVATSSQQKNKVGEPWFEIAHCKECGHVYGVFPKRVLVHWEMTDSQSEFFVRPRKDRERGVNSVW
jgi:uncharacterized Zn finger protein